MRNVRTSLIVGVLLVELALGALLLSHYSHRSKIETDVTTNSSAGLATTASRNDDTHVTVGSVVGAAPLSGGNPEEIATGPKQSTSGAVVTESDSSAEGSAQWRRPDTRTRASVNAHVYAESKALLMPRTESRRDSLRRHGSYSVAAAMTDELVKESAQLDPALPPPAQPSRNDPYRPGSNPIAAAMTDQLVRQSAKLDPALPPPN